MTIKVVMNISCYKIIQKNKKFPKNAAYCLFSFDNLPEAGFTKTYDYDQNFSSL